MAANYGMQKLGWRQVFNKFHLFRIHEIVKTLLWNVSHWKCPIIQALVPDEGLIGEMPEAEQVYW